MTNDVTLSLTVEDGCSVGVDALDFGNVASGTTGNIDSQTTVRVSCTLLASYSITLDNGQNSAGTQRQLTDGAGNFIPYSIYRNPNRNQPWGRRGATGVGQGNRNTEFTAYGRITGLSGAMPAGVYRDIVVVTVEF